MPKTQSNPIALGTPASDFALPDGNGRTHALSAFDGKDALLVAFLSNRCPFVVLIRETFASFAREYSVRGLQVVAINANDADAYPEEHAARLADEAERFGYGFPYLKDERQEVAKAYGAACTPDFFLFDRDRRLVYHGQFDDARPGNGEPVTGADLRAAADAVLSGRRPNAKQTPSIGCNIKWAPGNAPSAVAAAA